MGDPCLRSEVEALLASDEGGGEFLLKPATEMAVAAGMMDGGETGDANRRIGPYRILREIGHGGMGTVYLAERADGQYRKRVAIKLVKSHAGDHHLLRRFRNERQVLAELDHPNIAKLLDGGATEDGLPYLVMEYVDGIRIDVWCDTRKLPLRDRLTLFCKVCEAVQYAHDRRVIHRDLKPGNILVTAGGSPALLDFGIAKVLNSEMSAEILETTAGAGPLTPEYASPEQIRGEPVSPASDLYALGVVLYQLLTGRLPYLFPAQDLQEMVRVICEQEPIKPSAAINSALDSSESAPGMRRLLAGDLDKIVLMALRKEPERRYRTAAQLSEDLQRFLQDLPVRARRESWSYRAQKLLKRNLALVTAAAISAGVVILLVVGLGRLRRPANPPGDPGIRSLAVLPLQNLSSDKEQDYVADGITDALISDLARIPALRVISRTSAMSYKDLRKLIPEIARNLHVQTIVEGSVLRAGDHVRITIRLIDAASDLPIWSGKYEGEMSDALLLQNRVSEAIAGEIHVTLTAKHSAGVLAARRVNLGSYDAYLKGQHQYFSGYTQESTEKAISWFRQSLDLDPGFAPAYAGMAACYWGLSSVYYPPSEVMPKAKWAATKALELDDTLGEAHGLLGVVQSAYEFKRADAEKEYRRAIDLKPSDAQIHLWYSMYLAELGRFDEAVKESQQAQKLDPVSPFVGSYIAVPLYFARRYDQLIQQMQPLVEMDPKQQQAHAFLALAYEQKGEWAKAIDQMEQAYALDKDQDGLAQLGHMYAISGRKGDAKRVLEQLKELSRKRYVSAYNIGLLYAGLGERDEAFRWLSQVEQDRSEWFAAINVDPRLDAFHSDPRFAIMLHSVGLRP